MVGDEADPTAASAGVITEVTEDEIKALSDQIQKREDEFEVLQQVLHIPIPQFWDNFLDTNAKFSFVNFMEESKEKEIVMDPWTNGKPYLSKTCLL